MVRTLVRETLVREGYRVLDASDPEEARRISRSYSGKIHLIITDVVLPKANGPEVAAQLRRHRPGMKVIYMSGYPDSAVVNGGILGKEAAFLHKPFTPAALAAKVRETLENSNGGRTRGASD